MSADNPSSSVELRDLPQMDRLKSMFKSQQAYEPLDGHTPEENNASHDGSYAHDTEDAMPFEWVEYAIFLLLGVAMLWAWNMFLAAAPYFQRRFHTSTWLLQHFQAAEISVFSIVTIVVMLILSEMQKNASYPKRISSSLVLYSICFTLLALSTLVSAAAGTYFGFLMAMVGLAAVSSGLIQNGLFAIASGYGRSEYTQAIMTGQAIAGVLPACAQIITVLAVPSKASDDRAAPEASPKSAFIYFLAATAVSMAALLAFLFLLRRQTSKRSHAATFEGSKPTAAGVSEGDMLTNSRSHSRTNHDRQQGDNPVERTPVPLLTLFKKLPFLSAAVFICFAVTMVFPVFTASITSVSHIDSAVFIPLGFLLWNTGDLSGRLCTLSPKVSLTHYPFALFCLAMARLVFVPLYFLCNVGGRGAVVPSDAFYLLVVQGLFGLSNGYLGSQCMMGAGDWVLPEEREAAGGFMGLMLVGGLTVGSFLSFTLGNI